MKTPRELWESEKDDPLAWACWILGSISVGLVVLMARVVVLLHEPVGIRSLAHDCTRPYKDPRCVTAADVAGVMGR